MFWAIWVSSFNCLRLSTAEYYAGGDRLLTYAVKKEAVRRREKTKCSAKTAGLTKKLFYNGILYRFWAIWVPSFNCLRLFTTELRADGERLFFEPGPSKRLSLYGS